MADKIPRTDREVTDQETTKRKNTETQIYHPIVRIKR